jgi:hypothetical protein
VCACVDARTTKKSSKLSERKNSRKETNHKKKQQADCNVAIGIESKIAGIAGAESKIGGVAGAGSKIAGIAGAGVAGNAGHTAEMTGSVYTPRARALRCVKET